MNELAIVWMQARRRTWEVRITRELGAPPEAVFRAWTATPAPAR